VWHKKHEDGYTWRKEEWYVIVATIIDAGRRKIIAYLFSRCGTRNMKMVIHGEKRSGM